MRPDISAFITNIFFMILVRNQYNTSFCTYGIDVRSVVGSDIVECISLFSFGNNYMEFTHYIFCSPQNCIVFQKFLNEEEEI
jgi:hypothetical protein